MTPTPRQHTAAMSLSVKIATLLKSGNNTRRNVYSPGVTYSVKVQPYPFMDIVAFPKMGQYVNVTRRTVASLVTLILSHHPEQGRNFMRDNVAIVTVPLPKAVTQHNRAEVIGVSATIVFNVDGCPMQLTVSHTGVFNLSDISRVFTDSANYRYGDNPLHIHDTLKDRHESIRSI